MNITENWTKKFSRSFSLVALEPLKTNQFLPISVRGSGHHPDNTNCLLSMIIITIGNKTCQMSFLHICMIFSSINFAFIPFSSEIVR